MKILHIINNLQGGGAEKLLSELVPIQNRDASSCLLILNNNDPRFYEALNGKGVNIDVLSGRKFSVKHLFDIRRFIRGNNFDVIHVHLFPCLYYVALSTIFMQIPLIYTEHSTNNRRRRYKIFKIIERHIYKKYTKIICISEHVKINLIRHLDSYNFSNKIECISNGILLPSDTEIVARNLVCKKKINLIMVGRFEQQKDHETVIRAMKLLSSNIELYFAGTGSMEVACKDLVKREGLSSRVHFLGFRNDINKILSKMDISILSSHWEGFGLAAVESMALGIPTIGSDVPGLYDVLNSGGLVFEKGNEFDLVEKIKALISSTGFYEEVSRRGVLKSKEYDMETVARKYIDLYHGTIKSKQLC